MVAFEIAIIVKSLSKAKLVTAVKRSADYILTNGGFIEKIEFLGTRDTPTRMIHQGVQHSTGSYFVIHHHGPPQLKANVTDLCRRDLDLIRSIIFEKHTDNKFTCTLHNEIKPPSYRPEVQKMIKEMKHRTPKAMKIGVQNKALNTGLGYNPF